MEEARRQKRVIINADDFGFTAGITEGILRAHREGVVTSTTVAANMPAAAEAVRRLAEAPSLGVGVHLNVSQGPPLSKAGQRLAGPDGLMRRTAMGVIVDCVRRPWILRAIEAEFEAQIQWVLDHGIRPTHLDSHRHAHAFGPIFARVARLARRYHVRFVRWHREALGPGWPAAPAKQTRNRRVLDAMGWFNNLLGRDLRGTGGTWGIAHTGYLDAAWLKRAAERLPVGVTEIMTHPGLVDDLPADMTRLLDSRKTELAALCDPAVKEAFAKHDIELTHYGRL